MEIEFTIEGLEQLKKNTDAVVSHIQDGTLISRAAYAVERQAKINATGRPGPNVQTGRLRSSIATEIISKEEARVGTNVFYAPFVELGHRQHPGQFVPPLRRRLVASFAPAYPFMRPALNQCKAELEGLCVTFSHELEAEWSK